MCRYPLLFWLQGLQANIGIMMVLRGWRNAISAEGWLVSMRLLLSLLCRIFFKPNSCH